MSTIVNYKGMKVLDPDPTGAGGLAIQDNFKHLVDFVGGQVSTGAGTNTQSVILPTFWALG